MKSRLARAATADERDNDRMRVAVLVTLVLSVASQAALWATQGQAADDLFANVTFPVLIVAHGGLLVGLATRRLSLLLVSRSLFVSLVVALFGRVLAWTLAPPAGGASALAVLSVLGVGGVLYALAFVLFGTRRGVRLSVLTYLAFLLVPGLAVIAGLIPTRGSGPLAYAFLLLVAGQGVLICLMWLLASRLEALATAQVTARMLETQATTDPLTGLANRRRLDDELERAFARARRYAHPLSLVLIDLDRFKDVNDRFGHDVGDRVLAETARRLRGVVRDADLPGRWGGEEFLVVAPDTSCAAARALAERGRRAVGGAPMASGDVTASVGVATLGPDEDLRELQRRADLALYTAKREGRDRVCALADVDGALATIPISGAGP